MSFNQRSEQVSFYLGPFCVNNVYERSGPDEQSDSTALGSKAAENISADRWFKVREQFTDLVDREAKLKDGLNIKQSTQAHTHMHTSQETMGAEREVGAD